MTALTDIVNLNCDASCLPTEAWFAAMEGGTGSVVYRWLEAYARLGRKMVLGVTGAAVADLVQRNPHSVELIRSRPDIFQIVVRPFSHDAALLRTVEGFRVNLDLGWRTLRREFGEIAPYFLPPEFMLTVEQLAVLHKSGIVGTFINESRYSSFQQARIPDRPYRILGLFGVELSCLPITGSLTRAYLSSLDQFCAKPWNQAVAASGSDSVFSWRDGESVLLFPGGLEREIRWLESESEQIERRHIDLAGELPAAAEFGEWTFTSYPIHPLSAWMKEFRMMGYLNRLWSLEERLPSFTTTEIALWLQAINSDILSSVEKSAIEKRLLVAEDSNLHFDHTLHRSERCFEGWEYLALLEGMANDHQIDYLETSTRSHIVKTRGRIAYLQDLLGDQQAA